MQTILDIPESLHEALRQRAERSGDSIEALILKAVEHSYPLSQAPKKGGRVTGPLIHGEVGPLFPVDRVDDDLIFP